MLLLSFLGLHVNILPLYLLLLAVGTVFLPYLEPITKYNLGLQVFAAKAGIIVLLLYFCNLKVIYKIVLYILALDAVWLCFGGKGIFYGVTLDTTVFMIFLPLFWRDKVLRFSTPLLLFATFKLGGATSLLALAVHFFYRPITRYTFLGALGALLYLYNNPIALVGNRWDIIEPSMQWWANNANHYFGTGIGSYEWVAGYHNLQPPLMWLHSDWLQILFEIGFVGLFVVLTAYVIKIYQCPREDRGMWLALGVGMMFYSPIQYIYCQILVAYLARSQLPGKVNREPVSMKK